MFGVLKCESIGCVVNADVKGIMNCDGELHLASTRLTAWLVAMQTLGNVNAAVMCAENVLGGSLLT